MVCCCPSKHIACSVIMVSESFIYFLLFHLFHFNHASPTNHPLCHEHESSALLSFKNSFLINKSASTTIKAYPKTQSWNLRSSRDCCDWDGVECDTSTGHVIGLDLSHGCLHGSIHSNTTLFQLLHLQTLNLADNDFNRSEIPSAIGRLSRLTHLNLNHSSFSGQIPQQVLQLSKLVSLDLSWSSLHGEFPSTIFNLPHLQQVSIRHNPRLTGCFPEFNPGSRLQRLWLGRTSFTGKIPDSIENLKSLEVLDIRDCGFTGFIPTTMANLTKLTHLRLSINNFYSQTVPSWLGKLIQLTELELDGLDLKGEIASSMSSLTQLKTMSLMRNQLTGGIPLWLGNLTHLTWLLFSGNKLHGSVPASMFGLLKLQGVYIDRNNLSGVLDLERFFKLPSLTDLYLTGNRFSVLSNDNITEAAVPKMRGMGLGSCNLSKFPYFLRNQTKLEWLDLSKNNIHGQIPRWIWGIGLETLTTLSLGFNALTCFEEQPLILPWKQLQFLSLSHNRFQGTPPIPPPSMYVYNVGYNSFTGNLPLEICSLTRLYILYVSHNNLHGIISHCFGNFSSSLLKLNLNDNKFHGSIPQTFENGCQLRAISFNQNRLRGRLPRSLENCQMLEILDIGNNQISDTFPHWLGTLPNLEILNLRGNQFHGIVRGFEHVEGFSKLRIIDISYNKFSGNLPSEYFQHWNAMKASKRRVAKFWNTSDIFNPLLISLKGYLNYMIELTFKGVETEDIAILDLLEWIDFSSNRFDGAIPESITNLKGLFSLNLSNNYLTGRIPPNLSNLDELESLDLSHNHLSGQIPMELTRLTSLAIFDVASNNLSGFIPHGNQFDTFQNSSYLGNSKLCGNPLSQQCHKIQTSPSPTTLNSTTEFNWVVMAMGYVNGLVIGVVIGWVLTTRKHEWFAEIFGTGIGRKQQRPKRRRR